MVGCRLSPYNNIVLSRPLSHRDNRARVMGYPSSFFGIVRCFGEKCPRRVLLSIFSEFCDRMDVEKCQKSENYLSVFFCFRCPNKSSSDDRIGVECFLGRKKLNQNQTFNETFSRPSTGLVVEDTRKDLECSLRCNFSL